jgi:hypothetical protein
MSPRLKELQLELRGARSRLEEWVRRLGALRKVAAAGPREGAGYAEAAPTPADAPRVPPAPLLHGLDAGANALDDVELHFEVLDTEDPGHEGR